MYCITLNIERKERNAHMQKKIQGAYLEEQEQPSIPFPSMGRKTKQRKIRK
jgi:hypothetical protein